MVSKSHSSIFWLWETTLARNYLSPVPCSSVASVLVFRLEYCEFNPHTEHSNLARGGFFTADAHPGWVLAGSNGETSATRSSFIHGKDASVGGLLRVMTLTGDDCLPEPAGACVRSGSGNSEIVLWVWPGEGLTTPGHYQSINLISKAPISPAKPGLVTWQPSQCSTAKSRKQFCNMNRP